MPTSPKLVLAALLLAATTTVDAQTRMLRNPSVSRANVAFAYAGNIWITERAGGIARRLTSFQGEASNPKLSPDGKTVAFSAQYAGNVDVYLLPIEGGEPKRLTFHPGADQVQGWTPDGREIVFASGRASNGPGAIPRFYKIGIDGGVESAMPQPRAYQGKISPDGKKLAYRMNNSWDEERRNYRGGQNRPIWIEDMSTHDVTTPPWTDSKDMDPAWIGDVVYFLSDRDGVSNVWSYDTKSKALKQQTTFKDYDVKSLDASTSANAVVFEQAGYIHELDPATGREKTLAITANGDFPWMMTQWKDVTARIGALALSPTGKRAAVEARGEIFTIPAEKGDARNLTNSSASAERDPSWSPDGKWISYFSDASGEYQLVLASQDGATRREIKLPEPNHAYTPEWSPDSKKLLFHDTNLKLWVVDIASGKATHVDTDPFMIPERSISPKFSPDGRWIAYAKRLPSMFRAIFAYNVETGQKIQMTDGLADAKRPAWDASGKYLWFLASTNFGPTSGWLDMTSYDHPVTSALYLTVLKKGEPSPLLPESDEEREAAARDSATPRPAPAPAPAPAVAAPAVIPSERSESRDLHLPSRVVVSIDADGLTQRTIAVPGLAQRDYNNLTAGVAGTVYWTEAIPAIGTQEGGAGGGGGGSNTLHRYVIKDRRAAQFATGVAAFTLSADGHKLLYRTPGAAGGLFLVDADKTVPAPASGRLAVQLRANVDPRAEFAQMFNEGWRIQRDYIYVKNLHGTDWPKMKTMYGALLPYVNHRADLNYLMDQMGAEIAIGHSFVRGGDIPEVAPVTAGLLGADFTIENGRYRIAKIYDAESWNPELRAPLSAPGVDVRVGDYILAINGVDLRGTDNIYRLLDGTSGRQTVLSVSGVPTIVTPSERQRVEGSAPSAVRQVTVVPIPNEGGLRTRAWVESRRRMVDSLSKGTLAYVYVPSTAQPGYVSFNRYYFAQQDKKGAIIDERFNSGGSAADYIIDLLQRDFDGYFNNPVGDRYPFTSPAAGIWGPKVMIVNEMAGSGGDLMPWMFKNRKIGPLVGKRTWGGLVGTWDTPPFVDGGSMIAPRGGFFTRDDKWDVENVGTAPDIDVENWPKDVIAGRDPQLERAVAEAMRLQGANKVVRATREPASPEWGKRKPNLSP